MLLAAVDIGAAHTTLRCAEKVFDVFGRVALAEERRREEIARMLAGAEITNEARAAAERLIKQAS
jgi:DNA repair ATPase RecN